MALVYVVRDQQTGGRGALKILRPHVIDDDPKALERFEREARASMVIGSPHVVVTHDSGVTDGLPWILMELLDGRTLDVYMSERAPTLDARWLILDQTLGTMALAHRAGMLHRDLKNENIMVLERQGWPFVKLLDFGGAKRIKETLSASLTESGLGTPLWAAPEQARVGVRLTPACDVWALGLLAFYVFTSKLYWRHMNIEGSTAIDIAVEVMRATIEPASTRAAWLGYAKSLPHAFDDWFAHCVSRDPAQRFETAAAAHAALMSLR